MASPATARVALCCLVLGVAAVQYVAATSQRRVTLISSGPLITTRASPLAAVESLPARASGNNALSRRLLGSAAAADDEQHVWLVGFPADKEAHVHATLRTHGASCLHPLPGADDHHWMITGSARAVDELLRDHPDATAALMPHTAKMSPELQLALAGQGSDLRQAKSRRKPMTLEALMPEATPKQLAHVASAAHKDVAHDLPSYCKLEARVASHVLRLTLCAQGLPTAAAWLAAHHRVTWIGLFRPPRLHDLHASAMLQAPSLITDGTMPPAGAQDGVKSGLFPYWAAGIDGSNQTVGVVDSGLDTDSCFFFDPDVATTTNITTTGLAAFQGVSQSDVNDDGTLDYDVSRLYNVSLYQDLSHRKVVQYVYFADAKPEAHGTESSGCVAGHAYGTDYTTDPTVATGAAPAAKIAFLDIGKGEGGLTTFTGQDPGMLYEIQRQVGARISSNSWASSNYGYGPMCYQWDAWTRGTPDTLILVSAGNEGALMETMTTTGNVGDPAGCKNILSVGATESWKDAEGQTTNLADAGGQLIRVNTSGWTGLSSSEYANEPYKSRVVAQVADGTREELGTLLADYLYVPGTTTMLSDYTYSYFSSDDFDEDVAAIREAGKQPANNRTYNSFTADLRSLWADGLYDSIQILMADPIDACQPLTKSYAPADPSTQATLVLVRQSFRNATCYGFQSLNNVWGSNATGAIMYWDDAEGTVQSGAAAFANTTYVAVGISPVMGARMEQRLAGGDALYLQLDEVKAHPIPAENIAGFSSYAAWVRDPLSDGQEGPDSVTRVKPDVVAPGYVISAATDGKTTGEMDQCGATFNAGTSFSCPIVAGTAALVRQYYTDGFYPSGAKDPTAGFAPSAALLKATLIAGAAAMKGISRVDGRPLDPPPTAFQGFGRVDLSASLPLSGDERGWSLQVIDGASFKTDQVEYVYNVTVPGGKPLIVTLAWADYPAFPGLEPRILVNNLDLLVKHKESGSEFWGNGFKRDAQNNVEKVYIGEPQAGTYEIHVQAVYLFSVARPQTFSLVVLGGFTGTVPGPANPANGGGGGGDGGVDTQGTQP